MTECESAVPVTIGSRDFFAIVYWPVAVGLQTNVRLRSSLTFEVRLFTQIAVARALTAISVRPLGHRPQ